MDSFNRLRQGYRKICSRVSPQADGRARKQIIAILLVAILAFSLSPVDQAQTSPGEYEVKAAFLFNFAKFIEWPPSSFASHPSSFTICFWGEGPVGQILDDKLQGKIVGDRHLAVQQLKDKTDGRLCQMVFVSSSESPHLADILETLQGTSVLLVGETSGFAESGGAIEFTLEDSHVRFTINTDAADRAGLKFSAKLLALAKIVHTEGHWKGG